MQVAVLGLRSPGRLLHVLEELAQIVALGWRHSLEVEADSVARSIAGYHSAQSEPFDPDLAVGHPETNFNLRPRLDRVRGFDQASARARVGKIAPDRNREFINAEFDRHETLDSQVTTAVVSPVLSEHIRLKRRRRRSRSCNWFRRGSCRSEEHTSELQSLRHLVCRLL